MEALFQEIPPKKCVVMYDIKERSERDFFRRRIVNQCGATMITNSVYLVGKDALDLVKTFARKITSGLIQIFGDGDDEILLTWDFWGDDTSVTRKRVSRWIEKAGVTKKLESALHLSRKFEDKLFSLINKLQGCGSVVKSYVKKIWEYPVVEKSFNLTIVSEVVSGLNILYSLIRTATMEQDSSGVEKANLNIWKNIRGLANNISEKWNLVLGEIEKEFNFLFPGESAS